MEGQPQRLHSHTELSPITDDCFPPMWGISLLGESSLLSTPPATLLLSQCLLGKEGVPSLLPNPST